jgi:hypothetical protein
MKAASDHRVTAPIKTIGAFDHFRARPKNHKDNATAVTRRCP